MHGAHTLDLCPRAGRVLIAAHNPRSSSASHFAARIVLACVS